MADDGLRVPYRKLPDEKLFLVSYREASHSSYTSYATSGTTTKGYEVFQRKERIEPVNRRIPIRKKWWHIKCDVGSCIIIR